jgi:hypothetical protein
MSIQRASSHTTLQDPLAADGFLSTQNSALTFCQLLTAHCQLEFALSIGLAGIWRLMQARWCPNGPGRNSG